MNLWSATLQSLISSGITVPFGTLSRSPKYVTYLFRTLSPLCDLSVTQSTASFDLHVLATPPAFILSQDQTLQFDLLTSIFADGYLLKKTNLKNSLTQREHKLAYRNLRSGVLLHQILSCQRFYVILWQLAISLLIDGINCSLVKELLVIISTPDNSAQKPLLPRTQKQ